MKNQIEIKKYYNQICDAWYLLREAPDDGDGLAEIDKWLSKADQINARYNSQLIKSILTAVISEEELRLKLCGGGHKNGKRI